MNLVSRRTVSDEVWKVQTQTQGRLQHHQDRNRGKYTSQPKAYAQIRIGYAVPPAPLHRLFKCMAK